MKRTVIVAAMAAGFLAPLSAQAVTAPSIQTLGYQIYAPFQPVPTVSPTVLPTIISLNGQQYGVVGSIVRFHMQVTYIMPSSWSAATMADWLTPGGLASFVTVDVGTVLQGIQLYPDGTHLNTTPPPMAQPTITIAAPQNPATAGPFGAGTPVVVHYWRDYALGASLQTVVNNGQYVGRVQWGGQNVATSDPNSSAAVSPAGFFMDTVAPTVTNIFSSPNPVYVDDTSIGTTNVSWSSQNTLISFQATTNCVVNTVVKNSSAQFIKVFPPKVVQAGTSNNFYMWDGTGFQTPSATAAGNDNGTVYGDDAYSVELQAWKADSNGASYNGGTVATGGVRITSLQTWLANMAVNPSVITITNGQLATISAQASLRAAATPRAHALVAPLENLGFASAGSFVPGGRVWSHFRVDVLMPSGALDFPFGDDLDEDVDDDFTYIQDGSGLSPSDDAKGNDDDMAFAWNQALPLVQMGYAIPIAAPVSHTMGFVYRAKGSVPTGQRIVRGRWIVCGKDYQNVGGSQAKWHAEVDYTRGLLVSSNFLQVPISFVSPTAVPGDPNPPSVINRYPIGMVQPSGFSNGNPAWVQVTDGAGSGVNLSLSTNSIVVLDPTGNVVPGTRDNDGTDTIRYRPSTNFSPMPGLYRIFVTVYDFAGNSFTPSSPYPFTVADNQAPIGSIFTFRGNVPFVVQQQALVTGPTPIYNYPNVGPFASNYFSGFSFTGSDGSGNGVSIPSPTLTPGTNYSYALVTDPCSGIPMQIGQPVFVSQPQTPPASDVVELSYQFPQPLARSGGKYLVDVFWWDKANPQNLAHYSIEPVMQPQQVIVNLGPLPTPCQTQVCGFGGTPTFVVTPSIFENTTLILSGNLQVAGTPAASSAVAVGTAVVGTYPSYQPFGPWEAWVGPMVAVTPGVPNNYLISGTGSVTVRLYWSVDEENTAAATYGASSANYQVRGFNGASWQPLPITQRGTNAPGTGATPIAPCGLNWADVNLPAGSNLHQRYAVSFLIPTPTPLNTATPTYSRTQSGTFTGTATGIQSPTSTATSTSTLTWTASTTMTSSASFTPTGSPTATATIDYNLIRNLPSTRVFNPQQGLTGYLYPFDLWQLPAGDGSLKVRIYNLNGDVIDERSETDTPSPLQLMGGISPLPRNNSGWWVFEWDGRNADGGLVKNGVYVVKFESNTVDWANGAPGATKTLRRSYRLIAVARSKP